MNYHDLLGVGPDATPGEIRSAWQEKVADVDPSDWRFAAYNEALTQLLKQHAPVAEPVDPVVPGEDPEPAPYEHPSSGAEAPPSGAAPDEHSYGADSGSSPGTTARWTPPLWLLAALAVLAAACVALAAIAWSKPSPRAIEDQARAAQSAAESATVAILSYDYRNLDQSEQAAESTMTSTYRTKYSKLFQQIKANAPTTQTVVTTTVVDSSIVRADQGRVQVLVLVDRPTTNKVQTTPLVYQDHVTVTLEKVGGDWLVADMTT